MTTAEPKCEDAFVVEPDIIYGLLGGNRDLQDKQDEIERRAVAELDLNNWIILDSEVVGFPIDDDDISTIILMTYQVPPRHWMGYLWGLLQNKERAMVVLEELKIFISRARGLTPGPMVQYF